jgi:catechol 2,3-dioxygenase-like lactoylglutathione lyase family enzyme
MLHSILRIQSVLLVSIALSTCATPPATFGLESGQFDLSFDHYAINVDDLNRSAEFYVRVFNLPEIDNGTQKPNIRWFALGNGMSLHVIETDRSQLRLQKGVHLAVSVRAFDQFVDHLRALDVPFENWPGEKLVTNSRPDGVRQVYLQDPDGYWVEVNDGRVAWEQTAANK